MRLQRIHLVAAARPNFMKVAPLYHALSREHWCQPLIVHTGQHYDANMSDDFFRDLRLPQPDFHLDVGSGTHAEQTGKVMISYEQVAVENRPDWIVVVGDVNSTAACSLVAAKQCIPLAHLEAGLRSRDRRMPEEINRVVTDALADVLWTPSADADENLRAEGVAADRIECIGNIMIDSFEMLRADIEADRTAEQLGLPRHRYVLVTLHRPSNVDSRSLLSELCASISAAARLLPMVFVVHPRTRKRLREFDLEDGLLRQGMALLEPLGYVQFMNLLQGAAAIITDSGGVQEESTYLNIPCLTVRENTERPITIAMGSNRLVTAAAIERELLQSLEAPVRLASRRPPLWDGHAADRAVASLRRRCRVARLDNVGRAVS